MNNGTMPEYGFNIPGQGPPPYGFNPQMSSYPPSDNQGGEFASPQFATQFLAQPVVTDMAVQYGNALVGTGKQHLEKYVPVTALKYYFAVNTDYVFAKLMLLFFPFTHKVSQKIFKEKDIYIHIYIMHICILNSLKILFALFLFYIKINL